MVRNVTLETMLDVLKVGDGLHLAAERLVDKLLVPRKFVLNHGLHWGSFKPGHIV